MLPRMNSSVKFFEPTVTCGVEAAPSTGWIALSPYPRASVVVPLAEDDVVLSLLSLPHAARTSTDASASSAEATVLDLMRDLLLCLGGRFRPAGVPARGIPANSASAASARSAMRIAPPSRPAGP